MMSRNLKHVHVLQCLHASVSDHLNSIVRSREEENDRLEEEINGYRDDIDNMMETFKQREAEMYSEMEALQVSNSNQWIFLCP